MKSFSNVVVRVLILTVLSILLDSCTTLHYNKVRESSHPDFVMLDKGDTVSVVLIQYSEISESSTFMEQLYALINTHTFLHTIKSEATTSHLIRDKILALPKNVNSSVLELLKPSVASRYLLTINILGWNEAKFGQPGDYNTDGKLQMLFTLYDMNLLTKLYFVNTSIDISMPVKNEGFIFGSTEGFDKVATELIKDTFNRELIRIFPWKSK